MGVVLGVLVEAVMPYFFGGVKGGIFWGVGLANCGSLTIVGWIRHRSFKNYLFAHHARMFAGKPGFTGSSERVTFGPNGGRAQVPLT